MTTQPPQELPELPDADAFSLTRSIYTADQMREYGRACIAASQAPRTEATGNAETYLRGRYGAYRGHFAWRELEEAFNAGVASQAGRAANVGDIKSVRVDGISELGFRHVLEVEGVTQLQDGVLGVVVILPRQIGEMKCWLNYCDTVEACANNGCKKVSTPPLEVREAMSDDFNGDNDALCRSIDALLSLDAAGALVPHGIGGHARSLLTAAMARLGGVT